METQPCFLEALSLTIQPPHFSCMSSKTLFVLKISQNILIATSMFFQLYEMKVFFSISNEDFHYKAKIVYSLFKVFSLTT